MQVSSTSVLQVFFSDANLGLKCFHILITMVPPPLALPYLHEENATPKSSFLRVLTMPSAFNSALTGSVNLSSNGFTSSFEVGKCPVNRTLLTS